MRRLALLLLLALAFSGCSDDGAADDPGSGDGDGTGDTDDDGQGTAPDGSGDDGNATDDGDGPDNATERRGPVTWHVSVEGNQFVDGSLTVQRGDTVVWTHRDDTTPHTVTADGGAFDSGACPGTSCMTEVNNAEFSHTFDETGEFPYHCEVHPSMTGTITVLEAFDGTP